MLLSSLSFHMHDDNKANLQLGCNQKFHSRNLLGEIYVFVWNRTEKIRIEIKEENKTENAYRHKFK